MFVARSLEIAGIALVLAAIAPLSIAFPQSTTQQVCYSASAPLQQTTWIANIPIPKFDPALGTLQQIDFGFSTYVTASFQVESLDSTATIFDAHCSAVLTLTRPDLSLIVVLTTDSINHLPLSPYDGTIDFAGTSGATWLPTANNSTSAISPPPQSDLATFTGSLGNPGTIALPVSALNNSFVVGPGNQAYVSSMQASAMVQVCYTYTPSPAGHPYCFGDGSSAACPCGNVGAAGAGCASSLNGNGASLGAVGVPSIAADSFVLQATGMPNSAALYFQGTTQVDAQFGDGKRCVGGSITRLGTKINSNGASQYPGGAQPTISVRGMNSAGAVRDYQVWYRNAAPGFCTPSTFNLTNGLNVTWVL